MFDKDRRVGEHVRWPVELLRERRAAKRAENVEVILLGIHRQAQILDIRLLLSARPLPHLSFTKTGLAPNDLALPAAISYNVSDAVPTLAPFLHGGAGFIGPVSYPTKAQFDAALAGTKATRAPAYATLY